VGIGSRPPVASTASPAALLLHGLTGSPDEMRPFADALGSRGLAVSTPLLPGHDDVDALERTGWRDWYEGASAALDALRTTSDRVLVVGFSLGGLLGLRLAALRPADVAAIATVSVPLGMPAWQRAAIHGLSRMRTGPLGRWIGALPTGGPDMRRASGASGRRGALPFPALAQLLALQREVDALLPFVVAPLLALHGALDRTADPADSARLVQRVGSPRAARRLLPESFHMVGLDIDRDAAVAALVRFALAELGDPT